MHGCRDVAMQPNPTANVLLAALRVQYENQAAFHVGQVPLQPQGTLGVVPPPLGTFSATAALGVASAVASEAPSEAPAQDPVSRAIRMREEKARKEAEGKEEEERAKCHLHKKPNKNCKNCQRYKDFVEKVTGEKAALRERYINKVRSEMGHAPVDEEASRDTGAAASERALGNKLEIKDTKTYGFPPLLQSHIVESVHFKTLMAMEKFSQVVDELYGYADGVEPYTQQSTQTPSALFVCVYRLFALGLEGRLLRQLLESTDNPYVRCAGVLFVRYGLSPDQLWPWLGEYVLDEEEFPPGKEYEWSTIGEYVEHLMSQDYYYKTVLPRLPANTKKFLETKLAQVPQYRKRSQANQKILDIFRESGCRVEACPNDSDWQAGEAIEVLDRNPGALSRLKIRIRWDTPRPEQPKEQDVHLGKVILADGTGHSSGSRGGVVDWSHDKGRSTQELLEELRTRGRDRAVCTSGKEYARRPVSFQVALPMDQGSASHSLIREETLADRERKGGRARDRSRSPPEERKKEPSAEHQARMKALFEKYGMQKQSATRQSDDVDKPDVMRLG